MMRIQWIVMVLGVCLLASCGDDSGPKVVLYTSVDEPVARPIVAAFEKETGIKVLLRTDTEATRTAGLAERLLAERGSPQADVWWGNEPFHTVNLAENGVLAEYKSPAHERIPPLYRDSKYRWAGTALRARVIAVSDKVGDRPIHSLLDLTDEAFTGQIVMARPTAGTTRGHVAALYTLWGYERADDYFRRLRANGVQLVGGNSIVAEQVGAGRMLLGLTDNDDVDATLREKGKLRMVIPDQAEGGMGTLTIPCTVGLVKGGPHADAGRKLVEYLLSAEVEKKLLEAKFARYSVFAAPGNDGIRTMQVEYAAVAAQMGPAVDRALRILDGGNP
jgi:iron(III) transport system substrate-binding protein